MSSGQSSCGFTRPGTSFASHHRVLRQPVEGRHSDADLVLGIWPLLNLSQQHIQPHLWEGDLLQGSSSNLVQGLRGVCHVQPVSPGKQVLIWGDPHAWQEHLRLSQVLVDRGGADLLHSCYHTPAPVEHHVPGFLHYLPVVVPKVVLQCVSPDPQVHVGRVDRLELVLGQVETQLRRPQPQWSKPPHQPVQLIVNIVPVSVGAVQTGLAIQELSQLHLHSRLESCRRRA